MPGNIQGEIGQGSEKSGEVEDVMSWYTLIASVIWN